MVKHLLFSIIFIYVSISTISAQSATFTDINPDVRSASMGNAGYPLNAGAFAVFVNTSSIAFEKNTFKAGYSYMNIAPDAKTYTGLHTVGGYYRISPRHSIGAGFRYLAYKSVDAFDAAGDITGKYTPYDWAAEAGYAFMVNDVFSVSANVRYITSEIASSTYYEGYETGNAFSCDVSLMYNRNNIRASIGTYNIGTKIKYGGEGNDLSSHVKAGVAYCREINPGHYLTGSTQTAYLLTADEEAQEIFGGIGAEYSYLEKYSIRTGYHIGDKSGSYATAGAGVRFGPVVFDFSYLAGGSSVILKNSLLLALSVIF